MHPQLKIGSNHNFTSIIFFTLISMVFGYMILFDLRIGLVFLGCIGIITISIFKPFLLYLVMISTLSVEGFAILSNTSITRIVGLLLAILVALHLFSKQQSVNFKDKFYLYFACFWIGNLISQLFADFFSISTLITYFTLAVLYFVVNYFSDNLKVLNISISVLIISTIGAFMILQAMGVSVKDVDTWRVSSGIGDPNEFALHILVLIPLCFYKILSSSTFLKKMVFNVLLILLTGIFFYTGSRGGLIGFLGLICVYLFYFTKKHSKELFVFLVLISVIFVITPENIGERASNVIHGEELSTVRMRFSFYRAAWNIFLDNPISGVGTHNFINYARQYGAYGKYATHSTYLEILSGTGVLGFIPFLLLLVHAWKNLKIRPNDGCNIRDLLICLKASFISIIISASFISADTNKIFWFLLALIGSTHAFVKKQALLKLKKFD